MTRTFAALRHRNFRLFWTGQFISLIGTWMQTVAQGWLVLQLTDSAFLLGAVSAISSAPFLLLAFVGGAVADRVNQHRLIIATQAGMMLLAFILGGLIWLGWVRIWHVIVIGALTGVLNAFDIPARQSFLVEMVGKDDLMNAIALNSAIFNAARIVGPAIAGALIAKVSLTSCYILNSISFLAVIFGLLMMRLDPHQPVHQEASFWKHLQEGIHYAWNDSVARSIFGIIAVFSLFGMPYFVLMPIFARDVLKVGASGFGLLMSIGGIGALIGAVSLATIGGNVQRKERLLIAGGLGFATSLILFSQSRWFPLSLLCLAGVSWALVTHSTICNTILQTNVPDALRGRVMGIYVFMFGGLSPIGNLQGGTVAHYFGAPFAVSFGAILCGLFIIAVFLTVPGLRHLELKPTT